MTPDALTIATAKRYPYERPKGSYLVRGGDAHALEDAPQVFKGRTAVLAAGSNAAPLQLAHKFAGWEDLSIPVCKAILADYAILYSAHFTRYGSIPATLHPWDGAKSAVHVTWLTDAELARMHETEARGVNYDFIPLPAGALTVEAGPEPAPLYAYVSRPGPVHLDGELFALAEIDGHSPGIRRVTQSKVQALAKTHLGHDGCLDSFILETVACDETRGARNRLLKRHALNRPEAG